MATSTVATVLDTLVERYGIGRKGTNTGTSSSQITDDANFGGPQAADRIDYGCQVLITSGTRAGDISQLSTKPTQTGGVMKVDPDFGGNLANNNTFIVLYRPLRWADGGMSVFDKLNQALQEFRWERRIVPVTQVPDGDMLSAGTSDFSGTNATLAKVAATGAKPQRNISVTATSAGGYAAPAVNLFVEENTSYYLEVTGWGTDSDDSGELKLIDVTNSNAEIALNEKTIDRMEPEILANSVTTPEGCKEVQIRLVSDANGDVTSWSNLIWRKNDAHEFVLRDRPVSPLDIGRLLYYHSDQWGERGEPMELDREAEQIDGGMWRLRTNDRVAGKSIWYDEYVAPAAVTTANVDTDTVPIPDNQLAAVAAELILRPLSIHSREWAKLYELAQSRAAGVVDGYLAVTSVTVNNSISEYPTPVM